MGENCQIPEESLLFSVSRGCQKTSEDVSVLSAKIKNKAKFVEVLLIDNDGKSTFIIPDLIGSRSFFSYPIGTLASWS